MDREVGFGLDKPPFVIGQEQKGLEIDIFKAALAFKGHTLRVVHMPNLRLQAALSVMPTIDAVATVRQGPGDGWCYVDRFIYFENFAIVKAQEHLAIKSVADLQGLTIVAWQNAHRDLGPVFERLFDPDGVGSYRKLYSENPSQRAQNLMFWAGRAKVIVIDKTIFEWYRHQLAHEIDTTPEVAYFPVFSGRTYYQAAFRSERLARDFDEGLKRIKSTGLCAKLYEQWMAGGASAP